MKYLRFTTNWVGKIKGFKSEFVAKTQFLVLGLIGLYGTNGQA